MSTFDGQDLFSSGPHRFHVGWLALRHVLQLTPEQRGVRLSSQGQSGRAIAQTGDLLADDSGQLTALTQAVEDKLDGRAAELIDDLGRCWKQVVMLSFEPAAVRRVGPRWAVRYRITYLQVEP